MDAYLAFFHHGIPVTHLFFLRIPIGIIGIDHVIAEVLMLDITELTGVCWFF